MMGSGSLARATCYSLALLLRRPTRVVLCARARDQLRDIAFVANAQARLAGSPAEFTHEWLNLEGDGLPGLLDRLQPQLVVNCSSYYSPWEHRYRPSLWTELLRSTAFGLTLPLQAPFAVKVAKALAERDRPPHFVNACYPDAVNPLLAALGLPIFCGAGNIAVLAAACGAALAPADGQSLQMLAHHLHLRAPGPPAEEARLWLDGRPCTDVGGLLAAQRAADGLEVNKLIGCTTAVLLRGILEKDRVEAHVPGPRGLPGGYPVRIERDTIDLDLPEGCSVEESVRWNERAAEADGVTVSTAGEVRFTMAAREALERHVPDLAGGFHARDLDRATTRLLALRERLRAQAVS